MKWLAVILVFIALQVSAQVVDKPVKLVQYVLDTFTNGTVRLKSGAVSVQNLNYNILTTEMIFEQGGQYMTIANPTEVDTVVIAQRRFVPVGEAFYEWLGGSTYPLFAEYSCSVKEPGTQTGFGTTTTTATTSYKSIARQAGTYGLKLPDDYEVTPKQTLYVRKDGQYVKVSNESGLAKLFPDKKELINKWIKDHATHFSKKEEVLPLMLQLQ